MKSKQSIWVFLLIAGLSAVTAIAVQRSIWGVPGDKLDQKIVALQQQLARSQAQRDSLNNLLAAHQDTLYALMHEETDLLSNLGALRGQLARQDSIIENLRTQSPNHDITTDSLLNDLNAIIHALHAGEHAGNGPEEPAE